MTDLGSFEQNNKFMWFKVYQEQWQLCLGKKIQRMRQECKQGSQCTSIGGKEKLLRWVWSRLWKEENIV